MIKKLGILAGRGDLPVKLIKNCEQEDRPYHIIAFKNQTDAELVADHPHDWVRLGAAGTTLKLLRAQGVSHIVMAGRIKRPSLAALRPDGWGLKFLAKTGAASFGDDGLLSHVITALEKEGFSVLGAHDILGDLLAPAGILGKISPDEKAQADLNKAYSIAHEIGRLDVGQAVVVQDGLVLALEAIEGTDAMLERCQTLKREGLGGVLVKAKKPDQENRADLPTIGVQTVLNAHKAGLRGIGVEANGALIVNQDEVVKTADQCGLFIVGL